MTGEIGVLILVANELCAYREVLTAAIGEVRPHLKVLCMRPEDLDREVTRLDPDLVLCSRTTEAVEDARAFVVLYPEGENRADVVVGGWRETLVNLRFDALLEVIDRIEPASTSQN